MKNFPPLRGNGPLCITIRWVDSSYTIHETALGLIKLPDTKALTLFDVIKDVLVRCSLPIASCIGQAYDGAACMSGVRNGVQALMKKGANHCLYVHCFAHSPNLSVQDVTKRCELLRNCMHGVYFPARPTDQVFAKTAELVRKSAQSGRLF